MPVLAQLQPLSDSPDERRRTPRLLLKLGAKVGSGTAAVVHDISTKGLLFETAGGLGADRIHVHLPDVPAARARIVWSHGRFYGCEFDEPIPNGSVSAALLRSDARAPANDAIDGETSEALSGRGRLAALLVGALLVAGAAWLVVTGHLVALATIVVGAILLIALLAAIMLRALDNGPNLKL